MTNKVLIETDLEGNFIDALQAVMPDCLFILGGRNGNEPKTVYCLVQILNKTPQGLATRSHRAEIHDGKEWQRITQDYYVDFNLTFYGKSNSESAKLAEEFLQISESFYCTSRFAEHGYAIRDKQSIQRVNNVNNGVYSFLSDSIEISTSISITSRFLVDAVEYVYFKGTTALDGVYTPQFWAFDSGNALGWEDSEIQRNYLKTVGEVKVG